MARPSPSWIYNFRPVWLHMMCSTVPADTTWPVKCQAPQQVQLLPLLLLHRATPPACGSTKPPDGSTGQTTCWGGERAMGEGQGYMAHRPACSCDWPGQEIPSQVSNWLAVHFLKLSKCLYVRTHMFLYNCIACRCWDAAMRNGPAKGEM